jgi:DNA-directed RNA polymerase specialized sigma24 family protein
MPGKNVIKKAKRQPEPVSSEEKIARLLGLLVIKDLEQKTEQVALLRAVGFEVSDVSSMLNMTDNHVKVAAHHGKKNYGKKKMK